MNNLLLTTNFMLIAVSAAAMDRSAVIFESRYQAWKESARPAALLQSTARGRVDTPEFQAIVDLGPLALPHIAAKMESDATADILWHAIRRIAKVKICEKYDAATNSILFPDYPDLERGGNVYLHWWRVGRFRVGSKFPELYEKWKTLVGEHKDSEAVDVYRRIVHLGLPVLPYLVDVVHEHSEFVAAVSELSGGSLRADATADECRAWWEKNKDRFTLPGQPPASASPASDDGRPPQAMATNRVVAVPLRTR